MSRSKHTKLLLMEYADCMDAGRREEIEGEVIETNMGLVHTLANKFRGTKIEYDDLFSLGMIAMMKAVRTFDLSKGYQFSTYFSTLVRNEILMFHRKEKKHDGQVSMDAVIFTDPSGSEMTFADVLEDEGLSVQEAVENATTLDEVVRIAPKVLNACELELFHHIVTTGEKPKQQEGARLLGVSQPHVSRSIKKMQAKLVRAIETPVTQQEAPSQLALPHKRRHGGRGRPAVAPERIAASGITKEAYTAAREQGMRDQQIADQFGLPVHHLRTFKKENGLTRGYAKPQGRSKKKAVTAPAPSPKSEVEEIRLAEERVRMLREELRHEEDHLHDLIRRHLLAI